MKKEQKEGRSAQWIAGLAAATATTGIGQAATVQIDLINNQIASVSEGGLSSFNADLSGGGNPVVHNPGLSLSPGTNDYFACLCATTTPYAYAGYSVDYGVVGMRSANPLAIAVLVPIQITDSKINGGLATEGFVEVLQQNVDRDSHFIILQRIMFDDSSTTAPSDVTVGGTKPSIGSVEDGVFTPIPEPSGLAMLALGAGGIALRRNRKKPHQGSGKN